MDRKIFDKMRGLAWRILPAVFLLVMLSIFVPAKAEGAMAGQWKQNDIGWWYQYSDGSWPSSAWRKIDGAWYYFDDGGYLVDDHAQEAGSIKGIDVSVYDGEIDWQAVRNDGISFAFVRVGHGTHTVDGRYRQNMQGADAAGIPVGVYFYSTARTEVEALSDAQFVIENLDGYRVSYPVVIDLEDVSQQDLSKKQLGRIAKVYCDEIRRAGYTPMLYCNEYWYRSVIDTSCLENVERWIARYNAVYAEDIPRDIWQCTPRGRVDGIAVDVDIDFSYKDYTQIITPRTKPADGYDMAKTGEWKHDGTGWRYLYREDVYPANQWIQENGIWYWVDANGYMATGWRQIGGKWYYLTGSGAMATGWLNLGGTWYYLTGSGAMATGWLNLGGTWYYLTGSGAMATGWLNLGGTWYYLTGSGAMATGWLNLGGTWYYLTGSGAMATGWLNLGGTWYYLTGSGAMATGWLNLGGTWYYLAGSGAMWANAWIGDYWVGPSGAMAVSAWVDQNRYYVGADGRWIPNA